MIWLVFALMTGAAVFCALWPLARRRGAREGEARSVAFYKAQLAEIERDVARGLLPDSEAQGARIEAARRLIAAGERAEVEASAGGRGRQVAAALVVLVGVPIVALGFYGRYGSPNEPDEPIAARLSNPAVNNDLYAAVAKIESHLIAHPNDGLGFKVIAPAYMRLGRYNEAVKAFSEALRLLGDNADLRADYGEAQVAAAGGVVTADARATFQQALEKKPQSAKARYYMALAAEQDGDKPRAVDMYQKLLAGAPPNAPWAPAIRDRLVALGEKAPAPAAKVDAPPSEEAAAIASLAPDQRQAAVHGMVDRLAARLATKGDDPEGWLRLIRAYSVLQEQDKAKQALAKAREALAGDAAAKRDLEALAKELGLES
jgi:cytochrome c-type biogenesis protein CcmH